VADALVAPRFCRSPERRFAKKGLIWFLQDCLRQSRPCFLENFRSAPKFHLTLPVMKKNFPLHISGKAPARVLDAIKHDVRKYVKRERRKPVPAEFDLWEFSCKVGSDASSSESTWLDAISSALDAVAAAGADSVYVEVLAVPARRPIARPLASSS